MSEVKPKLAKLYRHKETKKIFKIAPWWECMDPIIEDSEVPEGMDPLKLEGRKFKIGALVQIGWLICNEHDVYFGVHTDAIKMFEEILEKSEPEPEEKKMSRFDYVKYDEAACRDQANFKDHFESLEGMVGSLIKSPRAKALVMTKLEEAYMWVGKAIRDDQVERNGTAESQEGRNNE